MSARPAFEMITCSVRISPRPRRGEPCGRQPHKRLPFSRLRGSGASISRAQWSREHSFVSSCLGLTGATTSSWCLHVQATMQALQSGVRHLVGLQQAGCAQGGFEQATAADHLPCRDCYTLRGATVRGAAHTPNGPALLRFTGSWLGLWHARGCFSAIPAAVVTSGNVVLQHVGYSCKRHLRK